MDAIQTHVILWNVTCSQGHRTTHRVMAGDSYGTFIGSTRYNDMVLFDSWNDLVFEEVAGIVSELLGRERGISDCLHAVLGVSCDPAPTGDVYDFSGKVYCPICGLPATTYGPDNPPRIEVIALSAATHQEWEQLSRLQKRDLLRQRLDCVGCLKSPGAKPPALP